MFSWLYGSDEQADAGQDGSAAGPDAPPGGAEGAAKQRVQVGGAATSKDRFTGPSARPPATRKKNNHSESKISHQGNTKHHHNDTQHNGAQPFGPSSSSTAPSREKVDPEHLFHRQGEQQDRGPTEASSRNDVNSHRRRRDNAGRDGAVAGASAAPKQRLFTATCRIRVRSTRYEDGVTVGFIPQDATVRVLEVRGRRGNVAAGNLVGWANLADKERQECYLDPVPDALQLVRRTTKTMFATTSSTSAIAGGRSAATRSGAAPGIMEQEDYQHFEALDLIEQGNLRSTRDVAKEKSELIRRQEQQRASEDLQNEQDALKNLLLYSFKKGAATERLGGIVKKVLMSSYRKAFFFAWRKFKGLLEADDGRFVQVFEVPETRAGGKKSRPGGRGGRTDNDHNYDVELPLDHEEDDEVEVKNLEALDKDVDGQNEPKLLRPEREEQEVLKMKRDQMRKDARDFEVLLGKLYNR
ncbi:unnamed protein product [Amoebophrya sp. A120]|nr:unnamed protein product [Amoebophrya sp. A120]|eukprot:GSA120T00006100001.1